MLKIAAVLGGVLAWAGVAALSVAIAVNIGGRNQVLMFLPIIASVFMAWAVGELVTARIFERKEDG